MGGAYVNGVMGYVVVVEERVTHLAVTCLSWWAYVSGYVVVVRERITLYVSW